MKELFFYIWKFLRPLRFRIIVFVFFAISVSVIALIEPYIYKLVIDYLVSSPKLEYGYILKLLALWAFFSFISSSISLVHNYFADRTFTKIMINFFEYGFSRMMNLDVKKHLANKSGELVKKIDSGGYAMFHILYDVFIQILPSLLTFIAVFVFTLYFNWKMALISMCLMPVYIFVFFYGGTKISKSQKKSVRIFEKIYGQAADVATNILVVKSFVSELKEKMNFFKLLQEGYVVDRRLTILNSSVNATQDLLSTLNRLIIFVGGVYFIINKEISVGDLILFLSLSSYLYSPIISFAHTFRGMIKDKTQIMSAKKSLEAFVEVSDSVDAKNINLRKAELEFSDVSFKYSGGKKIFSKLNFFVPAHKITAIVGHSGSGKSTLVSLINRFYDVTKGAIKINGRDIREFTLASLRKNIGIVLQDNSMFNDTIFNNIKYGRPAATKKEVFDAAKKARIHKFIMSLPKKYDSKVGERGLKLSGGERQRVAIARAILKNPPILILDEATSALDSETEKLIQTALSEVMKGRTTIIIAHRLSTVRKADNILVFSRGKLKEQGSHEELMKVKGRYAKMVDMQVKGFFE